MPAPVMADTLARPAHSTLTARSPVAQTRRMLYLRTFGGLWVERDGARAAGSAAQPGRLAVLAVLAVSGERGISRQKLYSILWPESDHARARAALNQALYTLRRDLQVDALTIGGADLRLDATTINSDVADFERSRSLAALERAAEIYQGPFLDGVHLRSSNEFERWVDEQRHRLHGQAVQTLETLASRAVEAGAHTEATRWWRELSRLEPVSARYALGLMRSLAAVGDPAAALHHGQAYEATVERVLGAPTGDEVRAYMEELRRRGRREPQSTGRPSPGHTHGQVGDITIPGTNLTSASGVVEEPDHLVIEAETASPNVVGTSQPQLPALAERHAKTDTPSAGRARRGVALVSAAVLIVTVGYAVRYARSTASDGGVDSRRVLVTPFENQTGDSSFTRLGAMAADWIAQGLTRTSLVDVIPPSTSLWATRTGADDGPPDPVVLARESAARFVVTGSVRRVGDSARVEPRVIDASSGDLLPIGAIPLGDTANALALIEPARQAVLVAIATRLNERLSAWSGATSPPSSFDAYTAYAEGMESFARGEMRTAVERFAVAAQLDSNFAMPLLWSLSAHRRMFQDTVARAIIARLSSRRERLTLWERAFLDYETSEVNWDAVEAFERARRLAELAPGSEWVYQAAVAALRANRPREALQNLTRLDPERGWFGGSADYWIQRAGARHMLPDVAAELRDVASARRAHPDDFRMVYHQLAALARAGDSAQAMRELDEVEAWPAAMEVFNHLRLTSREARAHDHPALAAAAMSRALRWLDQHVPPDTNARAVDRWHRDHIEALYYTGRVDDARAEVVAMLATRPKDEFLTGWLGVIAAHRGEAAEVRRIVEWFDAIQGPVYATMPLVWNARILATAGDLEGAMRALHWTFARGRPLAMYHSDIMLERLWSYEPFREFIRPKG